MAIFDGYSRRAKLTDGTTTVNVWYRPAPRRERVQFRHMVKYLEELAARFAVYEWVAQHVVQSDINLDGQWPWKRMKTFNEQHSELFDQLFNAIQGVVPDSTGRCWKDDEAAWRRNLYDGVILERLNPMIAKRPCDLCKKLWFNETTGVPLVVNSTGLPMERVGPTMCETETGCPKGTPDNQKSLNRANRWAVAHYFECEAVGQFPDDAIVRANAVVIRKALAAKAAK